MQNHVIVAACGACVLSVGAPVVALAILKLRQRRRSRTANDAPSKGHRLAFDRHPSGKSSSWVQLEAPPLRERSRTGA